MRCSALPVRQDILQRCVVWQLSRRQQGTHKTKGRAEVTATAKKMYAQKGTGQARHGNQAAPQFRGGGKAFGPVVRSHASRPAEEGPQAGAAHRAVVEGGRRQADHRRCRPPWPSPRRPSSRAISASSACRGAGDRRRRGRLNFARAAANIAHIDVLPQQGANVYDILRRDTLVLTKDAVKHLEERLK